ncbi:uncharacterized protein BO80DRAFT_462596 [Aspergillus ibericus CBS 121593]|uniref:Uncharacterized protein n=1 Tax=Aspergillus ibericus CBS 121593 TaxID=1448316 RepID=A0A395H9V5_9EURO|nr:hypothetical protein BO80DRAFT_462596 [Aspergillus ibericus CBS 121593]RAL03935.1 hypothetical protein BO80DRAFT_462596 [Aspergillus ibericus CBS 121593]
MDQTKKDQALMDATKSDAVSEISSRLPDISKFLDFSALDKGIQARDDASGEETEVEDDELEDTREDKTKAEHKATPKAEAEHSATDPDAVPNPQITPSSPSNILTSLPRGYTIHEYTTLPALQSAAQTLKATLHPNHPQPNNTTTNNNNNNQWLLIPNLVPSLLTTLTSTTPLPTTPYSLSMNTSPRTPSR